jgi:hypothetical protein
MSTPYGLQYSPHYLRESRRQRDAETPGPAAAPADDDPASS